MKELWNAVELRDGRVLTLEIDPHHADVARTNIDRAGLSAIVEIRLGAALDSLQQLASEKAAAFDLVFIDADKANIPDYFTRSLELTRSGSIIVVDNVIRDGAVINADSSDPSIIDVRRFNEIVAEEARVSATTIQTVGSKGYDGFTLALVG
jgi:predicted O-methyltransferase YrrM